MPCTQTHARNEGFFTRNQVGHPSREGHPGVGDLRSADFGAFHPDECEDASEETGDDGADGERSTAV